MESHNKHIGHLCIGDEVSMEVCQTSDRSPRRYLKIKARVIGTMSKDGEVLFLFKVLDTEDILSYSFFFYKDLIKSWGTAEYKCFRKSELNTEDQYLWSYVITCKDVKVELMPNIIREIKKEIWV